MADQHHTWKLNSPPPLIRPHSLAKHRVIDRYLRRYVERLTRDVRVPEFRLTLIDGFAGGGIYRDLTTKDERPGTPFLMLTAMRDSAEAAQQRRSKDFVLDVEYLFIEKRAAHIEFLENQLRESEYQQLLGDKVHLLRGSFLEHLDAVIARIKSRSRGCRAIFVLDQFGYSDVPIPQIKHILDELENAEIILTFAVDALIDYLSENDKTQKILTAVGLPLGSDQIRTLKQTHDWRYAIQVLLHRQIHDLSGARFYTPFFIRSPEAHRDHWLIHLSGHATARDVMVGLHWTENTSFAHFGRSGLNMFGYDPKEDFLLTRQGTLPGFFFDDSARASTQMALLEELPAKLDPFRGKGGIQFHDLFARLTNESPATSDIFESVIEELALAGEIEVRDKTGTKKRRSGIRKRTDVIRPSAQRRLFRR